MFYVNNKQVLGLFLNGRNYNYLAYGFGKIIPENRNAQFAYINLAQRNLNQYRVEYGNIKSGYDNFPIARLDYPVNGIFHSPLTYYYGGNIVPTKNVPVYINNGYCAIRGTVYNDINVSGNIVRFADSTDFQGHNVNIHPESLNASSPYLNGTVMNNCSNCNINTRYIVPGFDRMNYCNFNIYLPSNANVEKSTYYSILSNSNNCNVYFNGLNSNLYSFRSGNSASFLFEDLNNCNLNLILRNSTGIDYAFGNRLNNCNIIFDNMNFVQQCFGFMNNCTLTGKVIDAETPVTALVYSSRNVNLNINALSTSDMILALNVNNVRGNVNLSNYTNVEQCTNCILNLYNGNIQFNVVENCKFRLYDTYNVNINRAYNTDFNLYNCDGKSKLSRLNNVTFIARFDKPTVTNLDNCFNSGIYVRTVNGLIENVYNTHLSIDEVTKYNTVNVYNCDMGGFPSSGSYHTEDCTFRTSIENAQRQFSSYITWVNVWPHATPRGVDVWDTWYSTNAGLASTANLSRCYLRNNNASIINESSISFNNNSNIIMDLRNFYNSTIKVNLPNYAMNIKLNIDCHNLNLGVFMSFPPHGLEYSSISADNIYCTTGRDYCVLMNYGTRIYCENFCNVAFYQTWRRFSDNYQPVMLINNYQHSNAVACEFYGGITRIGSLNYNSHMAVNLKLYNGTCVFINNTVIGNTTVNNSLLFLGTNVRVGGGITVTNGGLIVNKKNYSMSAISKFVNRNNFTWNFQESGPWGPRSLLNFCIDV